MNKDQREIQRKIRILEHAKANDCVIKTCKYFGVGDQISIGGERPMRSVAMLVSSINLTFDTLPNS